MAKTRGVYHRRKRFSGYLFPKGDEKHLCVSFVYNDTAILRMIVHNQTLAEKPNLWKFLADKVQDVNVQVLFANMSKEDYMLISALDSFQNGGNANIVSVETEKEFKTLVGVLLNSCSQFDNAQESLLSSNFYYDEDGNQLFALSNDAETGFQPSEEDIARSFQ